MIEEKNQVEKNEVDQKETMDKIEKEDKMLKMTISEPSNGTEEKKE